MKKLITAKEIRDARAKGEKTISVDKNTIITPSAKDAAKEMAITFTECGECKSSAKETLPSRMDNKAKPSENNEEIDIDLICRIVREVLEGTGKIAPSTKADCGFEKEVDSGGLILVRGDTVELEPFETGNPKEKVGLKDIVDIRESANMGAGFMCVDHCDFKWELTYEEFDYIIEGNLDITINGKTYHGKPGDVFFIPKNSKIVWSSKDCAKLFYTTYPANWAELAANK